MTDPRTLLVTGSGRGIGRAVSLLAAERGYRVVGIDIDEESANSTADAVRAGGGEGHAFACDVSRPTEISGLIRDIEREVAPIDVLVNNAARGSHTAPEEITPEEWHAVIDVSLGSMVFASQAVGRSMIAREAGGAIVNLSSIGGLASLGRGNYAYSIAKSGIIALTRDLAVEWAPYGIRVNAVAPSQVNTEGFRDLVDAPDVAHGQALGHALRGIPLGRLAEPEEVASVILFLAGPDASFVTGATLPVDGGSMALHAGGSLRDPRR
ncbi:SDR family NAD(P)-dependent oxidoreductase [Microbacterium sp. 179-I 3D3 NHS]|uniref:SDR family NAD(P)-dependent oxidoreductase n=1 Tax=unclassified Microbacterium TaxID=2609290 RepID=UPI0039A3BCB4